MKRLSEFLTNAALALAFYLAFTFITGYLDGNIQIAPIKEARK